MGAGHVRYRRNCRPRQVAPLIVDALKRLEYRGYDSAGVATVAAGELGRRRAEGKLVNLERRLKDEPLDGTIGIGHTRWATHGVPNETNAHPHFSNGVAIVHNGIIENFAELRAELIADGFEFASQTDTEVVAHLVARELARGIEPVKAAHQALKRLEGAFALAIMFQGDDNLIIGARNGPPLAVGYGEGEMFLGSDAIALAPFTNSITYLEDGDWAVIRRNEAGIFDMDGNAVERKRQQSLSTSFMVDKGNHRHFMEKEIHEQPEVISHTLAHYLDFADGVSRKLDLPFDFAKLDRLAISACGTAYLGGLIGKYWFERLRACRSTSISPRSSATARCRCRRTALRCSCRSPARPPTRWRRCAIAARPAFRSAPSSMCANRRSRANPT